MTTVYTKHGRKAKASHFTHRKKSHRKYLGCGGEHSGMKKPKNGKTLERVVQKKRFFRLNI